MAGPKDWQGEVTASSTSWGEFMSWVLVSMNGVNNPV